jgi:hypothetical protein
MNRTKLIFWLTTMLVAVVTVTTFALAEYSPTTMASVGWHDEMASVGWHGGNGG